MGALGADEANDNQVGPDVEGGGALGTVLENTSSLNEVFFSDSGERPDSAVE